MDMSEWQDVIREAVERRGYTQGEMTRDSYAFRQLCKMVDEVYEYAIHFDGEYAEMLSNSLIEASLLARQLFSGPTITGVIVPWEDAAKVELADVLVTVAMSASALGIDIERVAIEKATQDVTRGVR